MDVDLTDDDPVIPGYTLADHMERMKTLSEALREAATLTDNDGQ